MQSIDFNFTIKEHKFMKDIYEALDNEDTSAVVITALQIIRRLQMIPHLPHRKKSEETSEVFRTIGNDCLGRDKYQEALEHYNEALKAAPNNSRAMKLAYGNRSFILFQKCYYTACINDLKMALAIPTAMNIDVKLKGRLEEAMKLKNVEVLMKNHKKNVFPNHIVSKFLNVEKPNPDLPCASSDVGMVMEHSGPKLVAKNDVTVGTVLAVEEAFFVVAPNSNSCYCCSKKSLNLIPCERCCCAMFCDSNCRESSLKDGHSVECEIIEIVNEVTRAGLPPLFFKMALKIRQKCKNWKEFIEASYSVGLDRSKKSSLKEIYDVNEKFSPLCFNDDRLFVHGAIVNNCFLVATILHHLESVKNYLPDDGKEKQEAMRAFARVMMYFVVSTVMTRVYQPISICNPEYRIVHAVNYGCFSLLGKIRHACVPNVIAINLNSKMVLIACQPIEAGTPLTVHCLGLNVNDSANTINETGIFATHGIVCNCFACTTNNQYRRERPSAEIFQKLEDLDFLDIMRNVNRRDTLTKIYPTLCEIMALLKNVPYTEEYETVKVHLTRCLLAFADNECGNILLDTNKFVVN